MFRSVAPLLLALACATTPGPPPPHDASTHRVVSPASAAASYEPGVETLCRASAAALSANASVQSSAQSDRSSVVPRAATAPAAVAAPSSSRDGVAPVRFVPTETRGQALDLSETDLSECLHALSPEIEGLVVARIEVSHDERIIGVSLAWHMTPLSREELRLPNPVLAYADMADCIESALLHAPVPGASPGVHDAVLRFEIRSPDETPLVPTARTTEV